jgi:predicted  nucleic acid-binding Zn-ribbon protein
MNRPTTAREALIVEALGDVARLLDRVESLQSSMEAGRRELAKANVQLGDRLKAFETQMSSITQQAKIKTMEHIVQRTNEATRQSIDTQTRAMNEAARLAFAEQLNPTLGRLVESLQQLVQRVDRPWEFWLSHAATAASSAALTWSVVSWFAFK